jgi:hypothetical protein
MRTEVVMRMRLTDADVSIQLPKLKRPTLRQIQGEWSHVRSVVSDYSAEEAVTLRLGTVLEKTERHIGGSMYGRRVLRVCTRGILLGFQHHRWLLRNQWKFPAFMKLLGKVYIDFPGIIVAYGDGSHAVPYMGDGGKKKGWYGSWNSLRSGMSSFGRVAASSPFVL